VRTPQLASEVVAAVASARLRLHGFYVGHKGTTLFRPLVADVGSVLPSGADVSVVATVGNQLSRVTGGSPAAGAEVRRRLPSTGRDVTPAGSWEIWSRGDDDTGSSG
jgi:hypothetical protein